MPIFFIRQYFYFKIEKGKNKDDAIEFQNNNKLLTMVTMLHILIFRIVVQIIRHIMKK